MKILSKITLTSLLAGAALAGTANAQVTCNGTTQCQGPAAELIGGLFPRATGGVLIESSAGVAGLPCTGASGGSNILLPGSHQNYKESYATLLTASVAEKNVVLRIDTNEASCTLAYVRMLN